MSSVVFVRVGDFTERPFGGLKGPGVGSQGWVCALRGEGGRATRCLFLHWLDGPAPSPLLLEHSTHSRLPLLSGYGLTSQADI